MKHFQEKLGLKRQLQKMEELVPLKKSADTIERYARPRGGGEHLLK